MPRPLSEPEFQAAIEREFSCARCGHCCKGDGLVHIGPAEADRAARHLGLTQRQFTRRFTRRKGASQWTLKDKIVARPKVTTWPGSGPERWCIFLELMPDGLYGCAINPVKPDQCANFPRKWRNDDSMRTCVGLRALAARLRAKKAARK